MKMNNRKRELVKNTLLNNMTVLADMFKGNSEMKRKAIQLNIEALKLGWVHIALVGQTSCGKSTIINAMSEDIVVPENPMTSTPIPTYIAKSVVDADTQRVTVIPEDEKKKSKELTRKEFLTRYCYNDKDMDTSNHRRERFKDDRFAVVHSKGEIFDKGAVLLDTLGSCASEQDNNKTRAVLKGDVDFLIYIVGESILKPPDIAFLQCYLLGYSPKEIEVKDMNYPVDKPIITPDNLIILCNDKNGIGRRGFVASVRRIFKSDDCKLSDAEIAEFCEKNVWVANALYGRLDGAGFFDYVKNTPFGCDDDYLEDAVGLNRKQEKLLKEVEGKDPDALADIEKWNAFKEHIMSTCDDCFDDNSDFLNNKCNKVIEEFKEAKQSFEKTIKDLSGDLGNVKAQIKKLENISENIDKVKDEIHDETADMSEKMIKCVDHCLKTDAEGILTDLYSEVIYEKLSEMDTPPKDLPKFSSVYETTETERLKALEPIIKPIITELLTCTGYKASKHLWDLCGSSSESITDDVPIKHYRKAIDYLNGHIKNLIGIVSEMEEAGISIVGSVMPTESDLTKIGDEMKTRILKAIESSFDAMSDTKNWASIFNECIENVLKMGFIRKLFSYFTGGFSQEQFWDKLRNKLIPQLTLEIAMDTMNNIEPLIRSSVNSAYSFVELSIRDIYVKCSYDCDAAIQQMKDLDKVGEIERLIKSFTKRIEKCTKAIEEIERVRVIES